MMHGGEKSDLAIVAAKPANNDGQPSAELVERRAGAEGNAGQDRTRRAQDRASVSKGLDRVRHVCRQTPKVGAECPNWARSDLCGGRSVMGVPTAIERIPASHICQHSGRRPDDRVRCTSRRSAGEHASEGKLPCLVRKKSALNPRCASLARMSVAPVKSSPYQPRERVLLADISQSHRRKRPARASARHWLLLPHRAPHHAEPRPRPDGCWQLPL